MRCEAGAILNGEIIVINNCLCISLTTLRSSTQIWLSLLCLCFHNNSWLFFLFCPWPSLYSILLPTKPLKLVLTANEITLKVFRVEFKLLYNLLWTALWLVTVCLVTSISLWMGHTKNRPGPLPHRGTEPYTGDRNINKKLLWSEIYLKAVSPLQWFSNIWRIFSSSQHGRSPFLNPFFLIVHPCSDCSSQLLVIPHLENYTSL